MRPSSLLAAAAAAVTLAAPAAAGAADPGSLQTLPRVAQGEVGVHEPSGQVDKYNAVAGAPKGSAWSVSFVVWAMRQAGHPAAGKVTSGAALAGWAQRTGQLRRGLPSAGDVLLATPGSPRVKALGAAVVLGHTRSGKVRAVAGNVRDAVRYVTLPVSAASSYISL